MVFASICQPVGRYKSFIIALFKAKPKHRLGRALFLLKNRFLALKVPNLNWSG